MCSESIDFLVPESESNGTYVDATFGRGGHARKLLSVLGPNGRVIAIDKDIEAVTEARRLGVEDHRLVACHGSFSDIHDHLKTVGGEHVDGILMDLGMSSPQIDDSDRGFSFSKDGPLDMRMDQTGSMTAADWLNDASVEDISEVINRYGEERYSKRIAHSIVNERPLRRTADLVAAVAKGQARSSRGKHDATRTFQAVRIKINNELVDLENGLIDGFNALKISGRIVVIAFHSLEDRIVKRFFRTLTHKPAIPRRIPIRYEKSKISAGVVSKALRPTREECERNPRARSAVLRAVERLL